MYLVERNNYNNVEYYAFEIYVMLPHALPNAVKLAKCNYKC